LSILLLKCVLLLRHLLPHRPIKKLIKNWCFFHFVDILLKITIIMGSIELWRLLIIVCFMGFVVIIVHLLLCIKFKITIRYRTLLLTLLRIHF
jgi:hypothetical protein